ncbi:MAG: ImmA/IrrE family metallo-endopeptidase [Rubrobacteraceae bacterium]|nr:ImmA/IrrE family metallo-endopeptidase [Rubrobacteraceae bacterium]
MEERYGGIRLPVPTDALTKLIERDADDLDLYADLSAHGRGVDGTTQFRAGSKPRVRVAGEIGALLGQGRREHRLRTTLSHEYGHVMLHRVLYDGKVASPELLDYPVCKRDTMLRASGVDWMEWQAGYSCGALLVPISHLRKLVSEHLEKRGVHTASVRRDTPRAGELIYEVSKTFFVSPEAAKVRLDKLGFLTDHEAGPSLFDA